VLPVPAPGLPVIGEDPVGEQLPGQQLVRMMDDLMVLGAEAHVLFAGLVEPVDVADAGLRDRFPQPRAKHAGSRVAIQHAQESGHGKVAAVEAAADVLQRPREMLLRERGCLLAQRLEFEPGQFQVDAAPGTPLGLPVERRGGRLVGNAAQQFQPAGSKVGFRR